MKQNIVPEIYKWHSFLIPTILQVQNARKIQISIDLLYQTWKKGNFHFKDVQREDIILDQLFR